MKKSLLMVAAAAALSFSAVAEVQYELICVGTKTDGTASKYNTDGKKLGQGVIMTYDENQKGYVCELKQINASNSGFKIISNDQDKVNAVKTAGLSAASLWHTQFGCLHTGGILDFTEDGEPTQITDFLESVGTWGWTPGDMSFTGGVAKLDNVKVYFWPDSKLLKITGTPSAYKSFQLFECKVDDKGITSESAYKANFTHDNDNPGVYTVEYDFGDQEGVKYFDIRSTKSMPVYAFAKEGTQQDEITEMPAVRSDGGITRKLTAYSNAKLDYRNSIGATANKLHIYSPMKVNLTGKYNVKMDTNTGDVTFTAVEGTPTAVEEISGIESSAPAEYYNMQGVRIDKPERGIYIVLQGGKSRKMIVK